MKKIKKHFCYIFIVNNNASTSHDDKLVYTRRINDYINQMFVDFNEYTVENNTVISSPRTVFSLLLYDITKLHCGFIMDS